MSESRGGAVEASEAFSAVASETRFAILEALWDETETTTTDEKPTVAFAELREATGIRDSGQFNYPVGQRL